jgi:ubiquinone/menaquinone biosynthesis C-methylase UbiE
MSDIYNKAIGYSPLEDVDRDKLLRQIRVNKEIIDEFFFGQPADRILVAGAGQGDEAEFIHKEFNLLTIGVDINIGNLNDSQKHDRLSFYKQDLENLAFIDNSFSLIYSFHVLEHVSDHLATLRELHRVLSVGGVLFIGFPNRHRLFSYIGTSQKVSLFDKIKWNLNDYLYRISGRFENKYGAHAGFSEKEFLSDATSIFQNVQPVRDQYMLIKYAKIRRILRFIVHTGLAEILFPSNYYICIK